MISEIINKYRFRSKVREVCECLVSDLNKFNINSKKWGFYTFICCGLIYLSILQAMNFRYY